MKEHIQKRCVEAADAGMQSINVDAHELLYRFRPASLHYLEKDKFLKTYFSDVWRQLQPLVFQEVEKMGLDTKFEYRQLRKFTLSLGLMADHEGNDWAARAA